MSRIDLRPTPELRAAVERQRRAQLVSQTTVTTAAGHEYHGDADARAALAAAVTALEPGEHTRWRLRGGQIAVVSRDDLLEALRLIGARHTEIITAVPPEAEQS